MRGPLLTLLVIQLLCTGSAYGKAEYQQVTVDDPYIEMHTGPGKGYPIFHVVDRGDSIEVIKRRTDWFLIRTVAGKEGWASRAQMELTLQPSGERTEIKDTTLAEFYGRRWEMGIMGGDFSGATSFSMFGAYRMSANLSAELAVTQLLGNFSDGWMVNVNLVHLFFSGVACVTVFSARYGHSACRAEGHTGSNDRPDRSGWHGGSRNQDLFDGPIRFSAGVQRTRCFQQPGR